MDIESYNAKLSAHLVVVEQQHDTSEPRLNGSLVERLRNYYLLNGEPSPPQTVQIQSTVFPENRPNIGTWLNWIRHGGR